MTLPQHRVRTHCTHAHKHIMHGHTTSHDMTQVVHVERKPVRTDLPAMRTTTMPTAISTTMSDHGIMTCVHVCVHVCVYLNAGVPLHDDSYDGADHSSRNALADMTAYANLPEHIQRRLGSVLRMHVLGSVRSRIEAGHLDFITEIRPLTCLFLGFPSLLKETDTASPEDQVSCVQYCIQKTQEVMRKWDGSLLQFRCDEKGFVAICAFGLPGHTHEDNPSRGILAALDLHDRIKVKGHRVCVGVTTGDLLCTCVGARKMRSEYTVFGDAINLSARLMVKCKKGKSVGHTHTHTHPARDLGPPFAHLHVVDTFPFPTRPTCPCLPVCFPVFIRLPCPDLICEPDTGAPLSVCSVRPLETHTHTYIHTYRATHAVSASAEELHLPSRETYTPSVKKESVPFSLLFIVAGSTGDILCDDVTQAHAKFKAVFEELEPLQVKGKKLPVRYSLPL